MKKLLKNRRGSGYIDMAVLVLVSMMMIVLALNVFSFLALKQDMDYFAKEMIHSAAANGMTGGRVNTRYSELSAETNLSPQVAWSATYFDPSQQTVQLGDTITVTLTMQSSVQGFGVFSIPVTLTARHSGISQRYWRR